MGFVKPLGSVCLRGRAMEGLRGFRFGQSDRPSAMELELVVGCY